MLSDELQTENAHNGFRGVTNGGCPFWLQRSYRRRMFSYCREVTEELQMEDDLSGCRGVTDRECSFLLQRS